MKEIITIKGQQYSIESTSQLTNEQRSEVIRQLGGNILTIGIGDCTPTTSVVKGSTRTVRATASSGNGTYNYSLVVGSAPEQTFGPTTLTTHDFTVEFPTTSSQVLVTLTVSDTCVGGTSDTAYCTLTLVDPTVVVDSVTVSGCTTPINVNGTCTLLAECKDASGTVISPCTIAWSSSNSNNASVDTTGVVNGKVAGTTTTITATSTNGKTGTKSVTVSSTCTNPVCGFTVV